MEIYHMAVIRYIDVLEAGHSAASQRSIGKSMCCISMVIG